MPRRDAVVAALEALLLDGATAPNAAEIAERAGVSTRSIYVHFANLEDLFRAVAERTTLRTLALLTPIDPAARMRGLSVADQQMVEMAAALSQHAKVFLLDETTASLTPTEVRELCRVVRQLRDGGAALAFIGHRMEEVFEICDRLEPIARERRNSDLLAHKTLLTAFYQPSTRTRLAHEAAMHRLGGHVLGFSDDELAHSSLRFSFGRFTTEQDVDTAIAQLRSAVVKLRELSPLWDMYQDGVDIKSIEWAAH